MLGFFALPSWRWSVGHRWRAGRCCTAALSKKEPESEEEEDGTTPPFPDRTTSDGPLMGEGERGGDDETTEGFRTGFAAVVLVTI